MQPIKAALFLLVFGAGFGLMGGPGATALLAQAASPQPLNGRYHRDVFLGAPQVTQGIVYGQAFNQWKGVTETLALDFYEPAGDSALARPLIVFAHEGGFITGTRADSYCVALGERLTSLGYAFASITYRLTPAPAPATRQLLTDAAHDMKAAIRFFRANAATYRIDADRICAAGGSAGAMAALEVAYSPIGPGLSGTPGVRDDVQAVWACWGLMEDPTEIDPGEVPALLIHGDQDPIIPFVESVNIVSALFTAGIEYEAIRLFGAGHSVWNLVRGQEWPKVTSFLWKQLDLPLEASLHLEVPPSYPGVIAIHQHAIAGSMIALGISPPRPFGTDLTPFGELVVYPLQLILFPTVIVPGASGEVATHTDFATVDASLAGTDWVVQVFTLEAPTMELRFSNDVLINL